MCACVPVALIDASASAAVHASSSDDVSGEHASMSDELIVRAAL